MSGARGLHTHLYQPLPEPDLQLKDDTLVPMMLDFMLKRADFHETLSVASVPITKKANTALAMMSTFKVILQALLANPKVGVLCITYDNGTSFAMINDLLLGRGLTPSLYADPFWSSGTALQADCGTWPFGAWAFQRPTDGL